MLPCQWLSQLVKVVWCSSDKHIGPSTFATIWLIWSWIRNPIANLESIRRMLWKWTIYRWNWSSSHSILPTERPCQWPSQVEYQLVRVVWCYIYRSLHLWHILLDLIQNFFKVLHWRLRNPIANLESIRRMLKMDQEHIYRWNTMN